MLYKDGSLEVIDNGRGMPVDIHPEQKISGVELILTRLHAGAKFSNKSYQFSGGLHGVGISVVNALSKKLEVQVKRDGKIYQMEFADGEKGEYLKVIGNCHKRETGTTVRFWPDEKYFDTPKFAISALKHNFRAKAVFMSWIEIIFEDESPKERVEWYYEAGLKDYLNDCIGDSAHQPEEPLIGSFKAE